MTTHDSMRIIHVNDVAGVPRSLVGAANSRGLDWRLWPVVRMDGGRHILRRAMDPARLRASISRADLLHVHYGLFGYYSWGHKKSVLHLHGSDVRVNLGREPLATLVRSSIARSTSVMYSTPDLGEVVTRLRPDALWLPNPISVDLPDRPAFRPKDRPPRVLFCSRWDSSKGVAELLATVDDIRRERPEVEIYGLAWGEDHQEARRAGVQLVPQMGKTDFQRWLGSGDVVVGQLSGYSMGISDLEALATGTPVVAAIRHSDAYAEAPPILNALGKRASELVLEALDDPASRSIEAQSVRRRWVIRYHGIERVLDQLLTHYQHLS